MIHWLAEQQPPPSIRESFANVLFFAVFVLVCLLVAIWWMKRNWF